MVEIVPYEYYVDGLDWLRVVRRIDEAKDGSHVPESRRLYIMSKTVVSVIPDNIQLYKDEKGSVFIDEKDIVEWEEFDKYSNLFVVSKNL